jgi:hypothetical protein
VRPSAERPLAAGEKNPDHPVNPVSIKKIKIESISHLIEVSCEGSGFGVKSINSEIGI